MHTKSGATVRKQFVIAVECIKNVDVVMAFGKADREKEMCMRDAQAKGSINIQPPLFPSHFTFELYLTHQGFSRALIIR